VDAVATLIDVQTRYARRGVGVSEAALAGARRFEALRHYPAGDVVDVANRAQFYYHSHGGPRCWPDEHGHFHLFHRTARGAFFHLAALAMDARGWPLGWFTTNRWVTGETWVDADRVIRALGRFRPVTRGRLAPVARWLGAMVHLHADLLARLAVERDAVIARLTRHVDVETLFEDHRRDVLSRRRIDLVRTLAAAARRADA
jgi:hypothetical protein